MVLSWWWSSFLCLVTWFKHIPVPSTLGRYQYQVHWVYVLCPTVVLFTSQEFASSTAYWIIVQFLKWSCTSLLACWADFVCTTYYLEYFDPGGLEWSETLQVFLCEMCWRYQFLHCTEITICQSCHKLKVLNVLFVCTQQDACACTCTFSTYCLFVLNKMHVHVHVHLHVLSKLHVLQTPESWLLYFMRAQ